MGMFNSILADMRCAATGESVRNEIQIKWQVPEARCGNAYCLGDELDGILPEYDNTWVETDFVCESCSRRTLGRDGASFIKVMDQQRHPIFVSIENATIADIASAGQFERMKVLKHVKDLV